LRMEEIGTASSSPKYYYLHKSCQVGTNDLQNENF